MTKGLFPQPVKTVLPGGRSKGGTTMKLIVPGATGGIGRETARQAMDRGHNVTAFVRSPDALHIFADRITSLQGDLLSSADLARAAGGHDAVLSAFGPRVPISKSDWNLLRRFGLALSDAGQKGRVHRDDCKDRVTVPQRSIARPRAGRRSRRPRAGESGLWLFLRGSEVSSSPQNISAVRRGAAGRGRPLHPAH